MKKNLKYFIVIPAYNEAPRIGRVVKGAQKFTKNIIVVDDGSQDETKEIAQKAQVVCLHHRLNLGKGAAAKTGVEAALRLGADLVVLLDADGQHDPKQIPEFVEKLGEGFEVVFGARQLDSKMPFVRFLGNRFATFLIALIFGVHRSDLLCGFMAFTSEAYQKIRWDSARYGLETEIVARVGKNKLKYTEVPIETVYIDKYKGATVLDALGVLLDIPRWVFR